MKLEILNEIIQKKSSSQNFALLTNLTNSIEHSFFPAIQICIYLLQIYLYLDFELKILCIMKSVTIVFSK